MVWPSQPPLTPRSLPAPARVACSALALPPLAAHDLLVLPAPQQCRVVNAWAVLMMGAVVPLAVQAKWELARWRVFRQRHRGGQAAAAAAAAVAEEEEGGEAWHQIVPSGLHWPLEALLCSTLVWCIAHLICCPNK